MSTVAISTYPVRYGTAPVDGCRQQQAYTFTQSVRAPVHPAFFQVKITLPSVRVHFLFPVRSQLDYSWGTQGRPA
jgi:hypothetical protein